MICFCAQHCPLSGFHDAGCCEKTSCGCWCHQPAGEHRGSRPGVDPTFADAAFRHFEPETPDQAEAFREKLQGFSAEMRPRILQHLGGR